MHPLKKLEAGLTANGVPCSLVGDSLNAGGVTVKPKGLLCWGLYRDGQHIGTATTPEFFLPYLTYSPPAPKPLRPIERLASGLILLSEYSIDGEVYGLTVAVDCKSLPDHVVAEIKSLGWEREGSAGNFWIFYPGGEATDQEDRRE